MTEPEPVYTNVEAAKQFAASHPDVIVREVLWTAFAVMVFKMPAVAEPVARPFDMLFCFQMIATLLDDRARLSRVLAGDLTAE
jgi:hypothetical protein